MSVSKWAYEPWKCEGQPCPGDCDHCRLAEVEEDKYITWDDGELYKGTEK